MSIKEIRCSNCGKKCSENEKYCRYCQSPVEIFNNSNREMLEGIEITKWQQFIGEDADSYIKVFKKNEGKRYFTDFHIAFFFPVLWMFYRKMYSQAIITQVVYLLCVLLIILISGTSPLMLLLIPVCLGFNIFIAFIAHLLYRNHCKKFLLSSSNNMHRGGTDIIAAIIGGIGTRAVSSFVLAFAILLI